jgi:hypothetical protein
VELSVSLIKKLRVRFEDNDVWTMTVAQIFLKHEQALFGAGVIAAKIIGREAGQVFDLAHVEIVPGTGIAEEHDWRIPSALVVDQIDPSHRVPGVVAEKYRAGIDEPVHRHE